LCWLQEPPIKVYHNSSGNYYDFYLPHGTKILSFGDGEDKILYFMTNKQEKHLKQIKKNFEKLVDTKYRKGQKEHGGNLFDLYNIQLVDAALDEAIDQVVYLMTLKQNMEAKMKVNTSR